MELVIQDGDRSNTHRLDRPSGTLVIPFQPQFAKLRIDGREIPVFGSEPSHPEPTVVTPAAAETPAPEMQTSTVKFPMELANRRERVISSARVVLPRVPSFVHRSLDIDVFVKVAPSGKVASVAADYADDPLRNRLSAIASDAVQRWQFDRIRTNSYRDARIRLVFSPKGVAVKPSRVG